MASSMVQYWVEDRPVETGLPMRTVTIGRWKNRVIDGIARTGHAARTTGVAPPVEGGVMTLALWFSAPTVLSMMVRRWCTKADLCRWLRVVPLQCHGIAFDGADIALDRDPSLC